jgi:site-specific DNA-methyltransferase (adenine-specific)
MEANSIDAVICDPPYGLEFMGKEWDAPWKYGMSGHGFSDGGNRNVAPGFNSSRNPMCRKCHKHKRGSVRHIPCSCPEPDFDDLEHRLGDMGRLQSWHYAWAVEALRVAKPGCHLLAFGGTRTFHRLVCAIEDAGWEIRDRLGWLYGSGFPKSESVSLAIDKKACREELEAKLGRKPTKDEFKAAWSEYRQVVGDFPNDRPNSHGKNAIPVGSAGLGHGTKMTAPATDSAREWQGWGTALKPAWEPVIMARKPLEGTVAANVLKWGTGAINVDGCRVAYQGDYRKPTRADGGVLSGGIYGAGDRKVFDNAAAEAKGRWPANLIHDGSDEVLELFPQSSVTGKRSATSRANPVKGTPFFNGEHQVMCGSEYTDSGSAARFFYCAKSSRKEREMGMDGHPDGPPMRWNKAGKWTDDTTPAKNHHPTVKPLALMRYLCRLVTPPGGLILDPFMGSGSTLIAAGQEGFRAVGIEVNEEYCEIARKRIYGELGTP